MWRASARLSRSSRDDLRVKWARPHKVLLRRVRDLTAVFDAVQAAAARMGDAVEALLHRGDRVAPAERAGEVWDFFLERMAVHDDELP